MKKNILACILLWSAVACGENTAHYDNMSIEEKNTALIWASRFGDSEKWC